MAAEYNPWNPKIRKETIDNQINTTACHAKEEIKAIAVREISGDIVLPPIPENELAVKPEMLIVPEVETTERNDISNLAEQLQDTTQKSISRLEDALLSVYLALRKNAPFSFTSEATHCSSIGAFAGYLDIAFQMYETKLGISATPRQHNASLFEITMGEEVQHKGKPWLNILKKKEETPSIAYYHSITINPRFLEDRKAVRKDMIITFNSCAEFVNYIRNNFPESEPYKGVLYNILELPIRVGNYLIRVNDFLRL